VFAVADALDALTTDRPYRHATGWDMAREEILASAGTHFDPDVVAAFATIPDERFADLRDRVT
jgi:HD-GYP domain-containing protein (c-di-GMP phosphodiesterase class II)